jgi:actinorhodin biosynthesis protein ActVIA
MLKWKMLAATAVGASLLTLVQAQQRGATSAMLTAIDQIQIQQLVAEANYALQTGADNGYMYSGLFTPDGGVNNNVGREQVAAFARGGRKDARSFLTNVLVEPAPGGATGKQYEIVIKFVKGDEPVALGATGRWEDVYVKTPDGWRFKKRELIPSIPTSEASKAIVRARQSSPSQTPAQATPTQIPLSRPQKAAFASSLTPEDYLEIQQLVASYGHALDSGVGRDDNGEAYAALFAPDAVFGRPFTNGHDALVALARAQPHGRRYVRHFLTNIMIEPSPEGAVGRQYLMVIDNGEGGKPGSMLLGGHYEDVYVKMAVGWRFKSRTLFQARTGANPTQPAPSR